ncbi:MAG TPA: radical SAM protein [Caulobacteraceae bacterium]
MSELQRLSPFVHAEAPRLDPAKFRDPLLTAKGERRARVALHRLETLWFNTGTLCNLTCLNCYIESSPRNDALVYLTAAEASAYLDEAQALGAREIGFTGGEPFMNPEIVPMLEDALSRGFAVLVLTNAMRPMRRHDRALLDLRARYGSRLTLRVSLDHHTAAVHEAERGPATFQKTLDGLQQLARHGFSVAVAGRRLTDETEPEARAAFQRLFDRLGVPVDATDPSRLVLFPEMDAGHDVPEITEACWGILHKSPSDVMCASSRMVVRRKGADRASVVACTLLPYDPQFDLGPTLAGAQGEVALNHPHCAKFCVLGGASCSATSRA